MNISYLVTVKNEVETLSKLLFYLCNKRMSEDEIVVLDDFSTNEQTKAIISGHASVEHNFKVIQHVLDLDYGAHKNFGVANCNGDYIFQIDGDEMPPDALLGENLHSLIESNPTIEAFSVPRINAWIGLTEEHAKTWGWRLDISPTYNRFRAAWPDYQWRIFKRDYPRISFQKKLHEKIEGYENYAVLPNEEEFALYHDKTIEVQIATNLRYNRDFSESDNRGVSSKRT
jgi:glycosyltransferase involved in cell wall biosynthesis